MPLALLAGLLFYAVWVPLVIVVAAVQWAGHRRAFAVAPNEWKQWRRAAVILLAIGVPAAAVFGLLFVLAEIGGGRLLAWAVAAIAAVLVFVLLPRLQRW